MWLGRGVPEVEAGEAVHQLLQLLGRVEGLQPITLDDLLQLSHQALLACRVAASATCHISTASVTGPKPKVTLLLGLASKVRVMYLTG